MDDIWRVCFYSVVKSVVLFVSHLTAIARLRVRHVAVLAAGS